MVNSNFHYCWFGSELDNISKECMVTWKEFHPNWTIFEWNLANINELLKLIDPELCSEEYVAYVILHKKWANLSNIIRLYALYCYGGIYLDTDIKLIKPLTSLCNHNCFVGAETNWYINNAIIGSTQYNDHILNLIKTFKVTYNGQEEANYSSPGLMTDYLIKLGHSDIQDGQVINYDNLILYSREYFYPGYGEAKFTDNTHTQHLYLKRW